MAAVVLSRAAATSPADAGTVASFPEDVSSRRRWPTVALWVVLSAAIAAAWALLLFGDSLRRVSE
jgi:hypothetical protein